MFSIGKRIFFILGAGASVDSGLFTYRGPKGLYSRGQVIPEKLLTYWSFQKNPHKVWDFLKPQYEILRQAIPGPTYQKISDICRENPESFVLTQNVDRLISQMVKVPIIEIHGRYDQIRCEKCQIIYPYYPNCNLSCPYCRNICRPDIVFFRDHLSYRNLFEISELITARQPQNVVILGTSLQFRYLIRLVEKAKYLGAKVTHINPDSSYYTRISTYEDWIQSESYEGLERFEAKL